MTSYIIFSRLIIVTKITLHYSLQKHTTVTGYYYIKGVIKYSFKGVKSLKSDWSIYETTCYLVESN